MEIAGISLPVIEAHCQYLRPARYDDEIEVKTEGRMLSPVRMEFEYQVIQERGSRRSRRRARPCTPRSTRPASRAGCRRACARCSHEGARHRRRRVHRIAPDGVAPRQGGDRRRRRLLHRLLRARDQGSATSRRTGGASGFRFVETTIQAADLPALLDGVTHVFHLAAQAGVRKSWGKDFQDLHDEQRRGDADPARGLRRPADRAVRARVELVGLRRSRGDPDARRRAAAAGVALRRHQDGGRTARLPVSRELRGAGRRDALLHGLRSAAASRHGVQPLHPRGAEGRADHALRRRRADARLHVRGRRRGGDDRRGRARRRRARPTTSAAARACR